MFTLNYMGVLCASMLPMYANAKGLFAPFSLLAPTMYRWDCIPVQLYVNAHVRYVNNVFRCRRVQQFMSMMCANVVVCSDANVCLVYVRCSLVPVISVGVMYVILRAGTAPASSLCT
ncbi:hypothetical protein BJV82DRAFT_575213 [Fennellomyces sp. T-0311]|nr:hypothetical protein BJV82DRAFT_575213 [Fennellomyces sp. T-0311]